MKVLLLTSNSKQNMALSQMIAKHHELTGIVYENRFSADSRLSNYLKKINYNPFKAIKKAYQKFRLRYLENNLVEGINEGYKDYDSFFKTSILEVMNINQQESVDFIKQNFHDIIVVSGTKMVKKGVLSLKPAYGIINMHTGLSPYYNGGPSCTFWCLYNDDIECIGATVMFIDEGIDSGNIVLSDTVVINETDTYGMLEFKAIDLGNQLILKALNKLEKDRSFKGVPQKSITSGYVFYNRDYTFSKKLFVQEKIKKGRIKTLVNEKKTGKTLVRITE